MVKYDFVILGGGTAGCAAAYTAGKLGYKTLLIEKKIHLGGSITSGLVIPAMKAGQNQINNDFFLSLVNKLNKIGGQVTYDCNPGWFNPELTKIALDELLSEANVEVLFNVMCSEIIINNCNIKGIKVTNDLLSVYNDELYNNKLLSEYIESDYFIDATGNCDFAKKCNCNFLSDEGIQPVSLRFIMSGVDTGSFARWLLDTDSDRSVSSVQELNGQIHLSTAYTWDTDKKWALAPYFDDAVSKNILKDSDRNYFQVFTIPGMPTSIAFNCPRILIERIKTDFACKIKEAREAILRLSEFCKIYFPGFENAYISNIADELGIRVSRRIKGKYVYTVNDLKSGKKFKNPVLRSDYPIDVHSSNKNSSTLEYVQDYELPVESLMSDDIDNLFVVGRCVSADFKAQGALRIQPNCFAMAEGLIKYIKNNY